MTMQQYIEKISQRSILYFFLLSFGITWGLSVLTTENLLPFTVPSVVATVSAIFLHYGPAVAAIIMVGLSGGQTDILSLLKKLGMWRVGASWYLFVFCYPLALRLLAVGVDVVFGGKPPQLLSATDVPDGNPILLIPVVFIIVFFQAGLAEEIGWRGYGLPGLQKQYGALVASLLLGTIWGIWHFHPQNFSNLWPLALWYFIDIIAFTILITWVYNNTKGSILLVALFHTASNVCDWIVPTFPSVAETTGIRPFIIQGILEWVTVILIVFLFRSKYLTRKNDV